MQKIRISCEEELSMSKFIKIFSMFVLAFQTYAMNGDVLSEQYKSDISKYYSEVSAKEEIVRHVGTTDDTAIEELIDAIEKTKETLDIISTIGSGETADDEEGVLDPIQQELYCKRALFSLYRAVFDKVGDANIPDEVKESLRALRVIE